MSFYQTVFLFAFLPLCLLIYYLIPKRAKPGVLLAASVVFIAWGGLKGLAVICASAVFNHFTAKLIESRSKAVSVFALVSGVIVDLALLFVYKYLGYAGSLFGAGIDLGPAPMGISFFTFSALSMLFDVKSGRAPAAKSIFDTALYICFFGKLVSGPIVKYAEMRSALESAEVTKRGIERSARRFVAGLAKKLVIADGLGVYYTMISGSETLLGAWTAALCYAFILYFDFSGYSDMAVALGGFFGIKMPENFNYPYISKSVTDFWRRWHISLGMWFREYVYIPLGGSRAGGARTVLNLLAVWALTGIWHGANATFLLWGLYYFVLLTLEKFVFKPVLEYIPAFVRTALTFLIAVFGWVFFAAEDPGAAFAQVGRMFGIGASSAASAGDLYVLQCALILLVIAFIGSTGLPAMLFKKAERAFPAAASAFSAAVCVPLFAVCVAEIANSTYTAFLYAAF